MPQVPPKKKKKDANDETQSFQPKTLMEKHPIEVKPSNVIAVPPKDGVIKPIGEEQKKKKKKKGCGTCGDGCHCEGWNEKVGNSEERFY